MPAQGGIDVRAVGSARAGLPPTVDRALTALPQRPVRWEWLVRGAVVIAAVVAPRAAGWDVAGWLGVYGSFLPGVVVGLAFEAGQDARFITTTAFGSAGGWM